MHTPHIKTILGHVVEAVLLAQTNEYFVAGQADPLHLAQLGVKLPLQLVDDLRDADVAEARVVLCTKGRRQSEKIP